MQCGGPTGYRGRPLALVSHRVKPETCCWPVGLHVTHSQLPENPPSPRRGSGQGAWGWAQPALFPQLQGKQREVLSHAARGAGEASKAGWAGPDDPELIASEPSSLARSLPAWAALMSAQALEP